VALIDEDAMSDSVVTISRATAQRLAAQGRRESLVEVEAALAAGPDAPKDQYVDPVSLGALIVSVTQLAWKIYTDLKAQGGKPSKEVVARRVRIQLADADNTPSPDEPEIIDIVVDEAIQQGEQDS
jgi:hypothetical protein